MSKVQDEEKKLIKKEVRDRIRKGEPKQQILEEMSKQYKDKITIIKQLESTPSVAMKRKYLNYNYLLCALLSAIFVLDGIMLYKMHTTPDDYFSTFSWIVFPHYLNIAIDILLIAGAFRYRIESYSWIAARAIISLLQIVTTHVYYGQPTDVLTWIALILVIVSFLLGLFLGIKLCPPRIPKMVEIDIDGEEKVKKTVYVFPD